LIKDANLHHVFLCPLGEWMYPFMNYNKRKYKDYSAADKSSKVVPNKVNELINITLAELLAKFLQRTT
jgi:hypothetical protein